MRRMRKNKSRKNKSRKNMKGGLFGFFEKKEEPATVPATVPAEPAEPDNRTPQEIKEQYERDCTERDPDGNIIELEAAANSSTCKTLKATYTIAAKKENAIYKPLTGDLGGEFIKNKPTADLEPAPKPWYKIWGGRRSRRSRKSRKSRRRKSRK